MSASAAAPRLSAVLITQNSERTVERCLDSLAFVDEIVVLDGGSTDRTLAICRAHGACVFESPDWPGYGPQKNRALQHARGEWVLSIDSDEWITRELRDEIERGIRSSGGAPAFEMPRCSTFCGRVMRHSGWWPDYVTRLFRRGRARFSDDLVHERVIVDGPVARLRTPIMHEAVADLDQMMAKVNAYSTAGAQMRYGRGERTGIAAAIVHGAWNFFRTYVLRLGFLDGREGFLLAVLNAEVSYYRYAKLWLMQKRALRSSAHEKR